MVNKKLVNSLIKLTERLCSVLRNSISAYSCRKSKHKYKQYQLAVIWCLMKRKKENYRSIVELIELMPEVRQLIGLSQLPHFTTINKFFLRTNTSALYNALVQSVSLFNNDQCILSIDSTGYSTSYASRHYLWRIGLGSYTRKKHIKLSISVNTDNQCIVAAKPRLSPRNDNIDFPLLARQSANLAKPSYIVADKGYDSEANHVLANQLGSHAVIPLKVRKRCRTRGRFRRRMLVEFNESVYHKRSIGETVNSVMKRLMGSCVQSRSLAHQCKEVIGMCLVYNVHRSGVISLFYWCFLQSPARQSFINLQIPLYHRMAYGDPKSFFMLFLLRKVRYER